MKKRTDPAPNPDTPFGKKFLAQRRAAYFVWHRSFHDLGADFLRKCGIDPKLTETHFLPAAFATKELKLRELITLKQKAWGLSEIWYCLLKKRLSACYRKPDALARVEEALTEFPFEHWPGHKSKVCISAESQKSTLRNAADLREAVKTVLLQKGFGSDAFDDSQGIPMKVSLWRDTLSVYLPLCFHEHWHRAYKKNLSHVASLREDIAQCILFKYFSWIQSNDESTPPQVFFVPFFGSGTFYFEAVTMLWELAHVFIGEYEGFLNNPLAPTKTLSNLRTRSLATSRKRATTSPLYFFAQELDSRQIANFQVNAELFQKVLPEDLQSCLTLELKNQDFFETKQSDLEAPLSQRGCQNSCLNVLMNPPFGNRIGGEAAHLLYKRIGTKINRLSTALPLQGLILCPDQKSADSFCYAMRDTKGSDFHCDPNLVTEIFSLNFGSLDARVVLFSNRRTNF